MPELFEQGYAMIAGAGADLPTTIEDAKGISHLLTDPERCAYPPGQVRLLAGEAVTRSEMLDALDWLADTVDSESTAIFYFSGHGIESPEYYILPYGYQVSNLAETCIPGSLLTERLRAVKAKKLVILLDCCHAGGQAEAKGDSAVKLPLAPMPAQMTDMLGASSGRVVIASSRKDEKSYAGKPYSIFTAAFLEGLAGYGAFEQDGYARVLDVAMWLARRVPERSQDCQHPIIKISNLEDNFALAWYASGAKNPKPLPDWMAGDARPLQISTSAQLQTWQRMLANYRYNLLLLEERMSEYVDFADIKLQLIKNKRMTEEKIADLEKKLGEGV